MYGQDAAVEQQGAALPAGVPTPSVPPPNRAPPPSPPKVLELHPANVTVASTAAELMRAVSAGARDIEIRDHLDLTPLLHDVRASFYLSYVPEFEAVHRRMQVDALAMFHVASTTRSIRVSTFT